MSRPYLLSVCLIISASVSTACQTSSSPVSPDGLASLNTTAGSAQVTNVPLAIRTEDHKVNLCHATGNGEYHLIRIATAAEGGHRAHGDGAVGEGMEGRPGFVFGSNCAAVPGVSSTVITSGSWSLQSTEAPMWRFTIAGQGLSATGTWDGASGLNLCLSCLPGQVVTLTPVFDNPTPVTFMSFARGSANNYSFLEFGGPLAFDAASLTIPTVPAGPPGQLVTVTTPFTMSGDFKGYQVLGLSDPLLVLDVPVTGHGTATLQLLSAPSSLQFFRLVFEFTGAP